MSQTPRPADYAKSSGQVVAILVDCAGRMVSLAGQAILMGPDYKPATIAPTLLQMLLGVCDDVEHAIQKLRALVKAERSPIIKPQGPTQ